MDHLARRFGSLFLPALFLGCVGSGLDRGAQPLGPGDPTLPASLQGKLPTSDGANVRLEDTTDRPLVLVFSQETCLVCIGEAERIRDSLPNGREPINAKIVTVLIGADQEIADDWKRTLDLPWTIAYDEESTLFKSYCPEKLTPCTLIQDALGRVLFRKTGEVSNDEIRRLVGDWE